MISYATTPKIACDIRAHCAESKGSAGQRLAQKSYKKHLECEKNAVDRTTFMLRPAGQLPQQHLCTLCLKHL